MPGTEAKTIKELKLKQASLADLKAMVQNLNEELAEVLEEISVRQASISALQNAAELPLANP